MSSLKSKSNSFPVPAFYYTVELYGKNLACQEVSGLGVEQQLKDISDGGKHSSKGKKDTKFSDITLKLPIMNGTEDKLKEKRKLFFKDYKESDARTLYKQMKTDLAITLMNEKDDIVFMLTLKGTFPIKWNIENLNSMENKILLESISFSVKNLNMK